MIRHGAHRPGQVVNGYAPKPGHPRDDSGQLIVVFTYAPAAAERAPATPPSVQPAPVQRGVRVEQSSLL